MVRFGRDRKRSRRHGLMRLDFFPYINKEPTEVKQGNAALRLVFQKENKVYRLLLRGSSPIISRQRSNVKVTCQISSFRIVALTGDIWQYLETFCLSYLTGVEEWVEARDATRHPTGQLPTTKNYLAQNIKSAEAENPFLREDEEARGCNMTQPTVDFPERQRGTRRSWGFSNFCSATTHMLGEFHTPVQLGTLHLSLSFHWVRGMLLLE